MLSVAQILDLALKHHQAGRLQQAEVLYRQILHIDPRHAIALHLLGMIAHQVGNSDLAVATIQQALRLHPEFPAAHNNLGNILKQQGKVEEALAHFRQALRLQPDYAEAYSNLGNALQVQGKLDEAITSYRQALRLKPDYAEAYNNLGNALTDQGKLDEAIASYQQALRRKPDYARAYSNLGKALRDQGRVDEAIASCRQALRLKPDLAEAYNNLGMALEDQGKVEEAIAGYQQALRLKPDYAEACNNLGITLNGQGKFEEAIAHYQQALFLKPDYAEAYNNLGLTVLNQGKVDEAIAHFHQALHRKPDFAEAYNNLGNAMQDQGKLDEAIISYQQALRLKPDSANAYNNLGSAMKDQGKPEEAFANYQQALRLKPDYVVAHDNLLMVFHYHPECHSVASYQEARRWNDRHAEPLARYRQPHVNVADPERRLRVGYVSPDFRRHAGALFTIPLLSNHDHRQVEIFCYAEVARPDDMTDRLRAYADVWRSTVGLTDEQVAGMIRQDRIDILVDLALHTAKNRLLVFARKPAPVQATWLGYPGTTGMSAIDYRLTDPYLDPPGQNDSCYAEQSIRLPDTFWCYNPLTDQPLVNDLPALGNGYITFGCLNSFSKVNDGVLVLWARVLRAVPRSRLLLMAPRGQVRDHVLALLRQERIDEARVEFADRQPRQHYLQIYNRVDLSLDPSPCTGHTTSFDAFWMGVPTITQIGRTVVGRAGWSLLGNLGLQELAARTPDEFVALAVNLAGDMPRLRELRQTLRPRMLRSPLMDAPRFARNMEQAFRQMWHNWCRAGGKGSAGVGGVLP